MGHYLGIPKGLKLVYLQADTDGVSRFPAGCCALLGERTVHSTGRGVPGCQINCEKNEWSKLSGARGCWTSLYASLSHYGANPHGASVCRSYPLTPEDALKEPYSKPTSTVQGELYCQFSHVYSICHHSCLLLFLVLTLGPFYLHALLFTCMFCVMLRIELRACACFTYVYHWASIPERAHPHTHTTGDDSCTSTFKVDEMTKIMSLCYQDVFQGLM